MRTLTTTRTPVEIRQFLPIQMAIKTHAFGQTHHRSQKGRFRVEEPKPEHLQPRPKNAKNQRAVPPVFATLKRVGLATNDRYIPGLVNIQKAIENGHRNSGFTVIYPLKIAMLIWLVVT